MDRYDLLERIKQRRKQVGITIDDLSIISKLCYRTVTRFFVGDDVMLSSIEKITNTLGLDLAGNEVIDIQTLKDKRATEKALYIVSLVQDTSSLENQGLNEDQINQLLKETKEKFLTGEYKKYLWKQ